MLVIYCRGGSNPGGVLEKNPKEYASRFLIDTEKRYSTTEQEVLAIVRVNGKFRGYVERYPLTVTIETDLPALKWLIKLNSSSGRLA